MRKRIRLTESDLQRLLRESIKKVLQQSELAVEREGLCL